MYSTLQKMFKTVFRMNNKDSSCKNIKAKEALEGKAQAEAEQYTRQKNERMVEQEQIKLILKEQSLKKDEQFATQQKERLKENDHLKVNILGKEDQEEAKKEMIKRNLQNVLIKVNVNIQKQKESVEEAKQFAIKRKLRSIAEKKLTTNAIEEQKQVEIQNRKERNVLLLERWKIQEKDAQKEAIKEIMNRKQRNGLLQEQAKIQQQQIKNQKLKKTEVKIHIKGLQQETQEKDAKSQKASLHISPPEADAQKDIKEKPEVVSQDKCTNLHKKIKKEEIRDKNRLRIRRVPLKKPASLFDVLDRLKRRNQYCQIVEQIGKTLDQNMVERRLVQRATSSITDFQLQSFIGNGSFGMVYKGQHRTSGKTVAIKTIEMHNIDNRGAFCCVAKEQRILRLVNEERCQFLTSLFCSFQTEDHLCLVMEYAEGGSLAAHTAETGMPLESVRFYSACMVLGLQFLHEHNIAHRDLKPGNVLLYGDGYVKISDFGLSELGMTFDKRIASFCGTLLYKAPELFCGQCTRSVDWWALGVTIYKMLTGIVPFNGPNKHEIYIAVKTQEPNYPEDITEDTHDILVNLLKKDPQHRLGTGEHGTENVKKSPFFERLDWVALENKEIQPPFIPERKPHEQPNAELQLKAEVKAELLKEIKCGLEDLNYPMSSTSDNEA